MIEPRELIQEDWIFAVFLLILVLFTIVKLNEPKRLQMLYRMFSIRGSQIDFFAFDSNLLNWFNIILSGVFFMTLGLLMFRLVELYEVVLPFGLSNIAWFGVSVIALILYNLLRKLIGYLLATVVEEYTKVKRYFLLKQLYAQWVGLLLVPLLMLEYYSPLSSKTLLVGIVCLYAALQVLSYLKIAYVFVFEASATSYHLFVYICALEILPLIVLLKFVLNLLQ